ncbi:MAG: hypothetical protein E7163_04570 [Firmicutes bacterium]|nr:hypothetical protein [Bacillota bacterium]
MNKLFNINNIDIYDINTTILINSKYKYREDAVNYINNNCEVFTRYSISNIFDIDNSVLEEYNLKELKNKKDLTKIDEIKLFLLNSLKTNKNVIVFFNILTYVDSEFKNKLINDLKNKNKTIINYTTEIKETLLLDYLIVIHNNEVIMEGNTKDVLKEEKIIKKLGFNMPFIIELSNGLKYYNIVDKLYYDNESLVNDLWK